MGAIKVSALAVQIEAIGTAKVQAALREIGVEGERTSNHLQTHYGRAARNLSIVANQAVRTGELGGTALQKILTVGGDMAGMFGIGGTVVGALAVTGLAIYNYFDRARKEIEKANDEARDFFNTLAHGSIQSGGAMLAEVYQGNPNAKNERDRPGVQALLAQKAKLTADLKNAPSDITDPMTGSVVASAQSKIAEALKKVNSELERRRKLLTEGETLISALGKKNSESELYQWQEEAKKKEASDAVTEFTRRLSALKDQGDSALLSANRIVDVQVEAAKARDKAGIRAPGNIDHLAEDFASNTTAQLIQFAKDHPFDWEAYFKALTEASAANTGLTRKIDAPIDQLAEQIQRSLSRTLGNAIYDGFATAFSGKGLGGIFKGFGKSLMSGLGQIISDQGMLYLEYSGIMQAFTPLLGDPFTAGFAGAAIGAALIALGSSLGAAARGGGGHSHAAASIPRPAEITNIKLTATSVADQARYNPRGTTNVTVIGPNDPAAGRQIQQLLDNNARRS